MQTVMHGLMCPHDQDRAAEQLGKPGRPVMLASVMVWMAVRFLPHQRTLRDLPASGRPAHLVMQVRRFFCEESACQRKIFAERVRR